MREEKKGGFRNKHLQDIEVPEDVQKAVVHASDERRLSCAAAFGIAERMAVDPIEVGRAADLKEISIVKCQLGLYGYGGRGKIVEPAMNVASPLKDKIISSLEAGKLPCKTAWAIAAQLGLKKMDVSSACEAMGIKISRCQLGAF
jgi:hypothetical protein